ncbi:hypothetical protein K443DRAFT_368527 [Laccaria amethystina LaAM-08-1]|uniref:Uncharacterized protein n=1 Tax=Laccaria amethystina LaAM-08-1 TaxID=1095629 RepID=A0A0C9WJ68_9AGAR|nr:hypothetical protein K443DRAFT_368527 [Laccaria amethystina LaAM-08-1]
MNCLARFSSRQENMITTQHDPNVQFNSHPYHRIEARDLTPLPPVREVFTFLSGNGAPSKPAEDP